MANHSGDDDSASRASSNYSTTRTDPKKLFVQQVLEKAKKAELVQKQIQESLKKLHSAKKLLPVTGLGATPLMVDNLGRVLDESGNLIKEKPVIQSSLKVNRNLETERLKKQSSSSKQTTVIKRPESSQYIDPSLKGIKKRKRLEFRNVEPGSYIKQERKLQRHLENKSLGINKRAALEHKKRILELENQRLNAIFKRQVAQEKSVPIAQISDDINDINPNLIPLREPTVLNRDSWDDDEPPLEWWDRGIIILKSGEDPFKLADAKEHEYLTDVDPDDLVINEKRLGIYIEHPCKIDGKKRKIAPTPVMLTKEERKKLRRRKRQERLKRIQDKIRIGLIPPPPPKLKLSNLMNVLKNQSAADPSKVEMQVRQQMEERLSMHEKRNEERKLTPEQRSRKHAKKWQSIKNGHVEGALFTITSLADPKLLFKVDVNAQQLHLTGCCLVALEGPCIVIVEGSKLAIRRYVKLLMRRIKWDEINMENGATGANDVADTTTSVPVLACKQIWIGNLKRRFFPDWSVSFVNCDDEITEFLRPFKATHYFEMVQKYRDPLDDL
ncbi:bifunctional Pre-mRNA-splicing factor 3/U4-U6 small nuclear ribonucleoprotein Prp3/Domain of unknown function DUF1115 [Babesia duncani]|uniref:Uncharacterized protein n=1 Tax=Babesia duncani TaxID=323732 RepID=A0AAD9UQP0_9APIC|nr:bifunctional Pre-mRNA-splicing factor 3/U4-U6 small nuclear ribonucleoprotein Prp3/Domain of unknown function DUF1115 [Babesia duncani]